MMWAARHMTHQRSLVPATSRCGLIRSYIAPLVMFSPPLLSADFAHNRVTKVIRKPTNNTPKLKLSNHRNVYHLQISVVGDKPSD